MKSEGNINIMVVEDHPIYRVGLRMGLRYSNSEYNILAEADSVRQAIELLKERGNELDLILLDYYLPDGTALDVLRVIETICPNVKTLILTGQASDPTINNIDNCHIDGFVDKTIKPEELQILIQAVINRQSASSQPKASDIIKESLTPRELEIIKLSAAGKSAREIASELCISKRTVEAHKERIFSKLDVKSTTEMVNYAFRNGLAN
jgi:DNA-binding NarL/FixJ family response regulator